MGAREGLGGLIGERQCGAARYRLDAPSGANICHCRMCQKAGGGPFMASAAARLNGPPKVFASSAVAERGFGLECGAPLTYRLFDRDRIGMRLGSLDNPRAVAPKIEFSVESKLARLDVIGRLPARDIAAFVGPEVRWRQHPGHDG